MTSTDIEVKKQELLARLLELSMQDKNITHRLVKMEELHKRINGIERYLNEVAAVSNEVKAV